MTGVDEGHGGERGSAPMGGVLDALVVLGCRLRVDQSGRLRRGILQRRVEAAACAYFERGGEGTLVVTSGGRRWQGRLEADVIAEELAHRGVPERAIVRERRSQNTRENAVFSAELVGAHSACAAVVTSDWHLPRALALFRHAGLAAEGVGASDPDEAPAMTRVWQSWRERLLCWAQTR